MSGALNSVFGSGGLGSIVNVATSVIGTVFPPVGIAMSAANLLNGAVGGALGNAVGSLIKESGMPSFLSGPIGNLIKDVIGGLKQPSDPDCDHQIKEHCHNDLQDFAEQIAKQICQQARENIESEECGGSSKGGKGKGADSWLIALAKAMGQIAGKHADKLNELSQKMDKAGGGGQASQEFMSAQSEFQAESQLFGMLQSSFTNVLKTLGEGLTQMARKG